MKKTKIIIKILISLLFVAAAAVWVLLTLDTLGATHMNIMSILPTSLSTQLSKIDQERPTALYLILIGGTIMLLYIASSWWLSKIPILGFAFKVTFGSIAMGISIICLVVGFLAVGNIINGSIAHSLGLAPNPNAANATTPAAYVLNYIF